MTFIQAINYKPNKKNCVELKYSLKQTGKIHIHRLTVMLLCS